jgi:hypothetical protein
MYFDGSKRVQGAGAGVILISPQGNKLKYILRMSFPQASNNEVVGTPAYHPGFPLCMQFMIPGRPS